MPNTGKPSKDCHSYRKRRVKCDLGRPECQRCLRVNKRCPGYRDETDLLFRHEDTLTYEDNANRDRRKSRTDSSTPRSLRTESPRSVGSGSALDRLPNLGLFRETTRVRHGVWKFGASLDDADTLLLSPTWSMRRHGKSWGGIGVALTLCLFSRMIDGESRDFGRMDFLPSMLAESYKGSPLDLSCQAVALAYLSNKSDLGEVKAYCTEIYGKALAATNLLLCDENLYKEDEACVCVWLLSIYEIIHGSSMSDSRPITWGIHTQGVVELLRMRGPYQLQTQRTRDIFWQLSCSIQMHALIAGVTCPNFLHKWLKEYEGFIPEDEKGYRLLYLFGHDAAAFCATIRHSLELGSISLLNPQDDIFEAAERLDEKIKAILASYHNRTRPEISLHQISLLNLYRSIHIKVQSSLVQLLDSSIVSELCPRGLISALRRQCLEVFQDLTDTVLEIISHVLSPSSINSPYRRQTWAQAVDTLWLLRHILSSSSFVRSKQQEVAETKLKQIVTKLCIRQAVGGCHLRAHSDKSK